MIYSALSDSAKAQRWLCDEARIVPKAGGDYRLRWSSPVFESPGVVTQFTTDVDLGFTWFAPPHFAALMNGPPARTSVYVRLQESPEGVDVTLEHSGWGTGGAWEEARSWHFHFWEDRLERLKDYLVHEAYG
jgi:uncharacterized protein YndB with AHSA1/START domain